jgi:hypothetical protein
MIGRFSKSGSFSRTLLAGMLASLIAGMALADKDDDKEKYGSSINRAWVEDLRKGKVKLEGDHAAVDTLILGRNIPIPYDYVATLMRTPNAFGQGPACIVCHSSANPNTSYRGLDLSTCEGIKTGTTEAPAHPIFTPGKPANKSVLGRRMRNNRMPLGMPFSMVSDNPAYEIVREWIASGSPNDENFKKKVQPLFKKNNAFAPNTPSCTTCHMSNQEPPSFHELNLGSYAGIMLGADSVAKGVANATKIVIPGKPEESGLYQHLVEDRMPPGIPPTEDRNHPNTRILLRWIEQGARCN